MLEVFPVRNLSGMTYWWCLIPDDTRNHNRLMIQFPSPPFLLMRFIPLCCLPHFIKDRYHVRGEVRWLTILRCSFITPNLPVDSSVSAMAIRTGGETIEERESNHPSAISTDVFVHVSIARCDGLTPSTLQKHGIRVA